MDASQWIQAGMAGNQVAMQWYVLEHPGTSLPAPAPGGEISVPGVRASFNTNLLILAAAAVVLFIALK